MNSGDKTRRQYIFNLPTTKYITGSYSGKRPGKSDVATVFVFCMEVSADESPAKNLEKLSMLELTHSLFFLSQLLYNKTLNFLSLGKQ